MANKRETRPYPRRNDQHEYVSIDFGNNRRLTQSYSGEKASGMVPPAVFMTWSVMAQRKERHPSVATHAKLSAAQKTFLAGLDAEATNGARVDAFLANLRAIWPDWDVPPRSFRVGEEVDYDFGLRRGGKCRGKVIKVARSITVDFRAVGQGIVSMAADLLAKYNPAAAE